MKLLLFSILFIVSLPLFSQSEKEQEVINSWSERIETLETDESKIEYLETELNKFKTLKSRNSILYYRCLDLMLYFKFMKGDNVDDLLNQKTDLSEKIYGPNSYEFAENLKLKVTLRTNNIRSISNSEFNDLLKLLLKARRIYEMNIEYDSKETPVLQGIVGTYSTEAFLLYNLGGKEKEALNALSYVLEFYEKNNQFEEEYVSSVLTYISLLGTYTNSNIALDFINSKTELIKLNYGEVSESFLKLQDKKCGVYTNLSIKSAKEEVDRMVLLAKKLYQNNLAMYATFLMGNAFSYYTIKKYFNESSGLLKIVDDIYKTETYITSEQRRRYWENVSFLYSRHFMNDPKLALLGLLKSKALLEKTVFEDDIYQLGILSGMYSNIANHYEDIGELDSSDVYYAKQCETLKLTYDKFKFRPAIENSIFYVNYLITRKKYQLAKNELMYISEIIKADGTKTKLHFEVDFMKGWFLWLENPSNLKALELMERSYNTSKIIELKLRDTYLAYLIEVCWKFNLYSKALYYENEFLKHLESPLLNSLYAQTDEIHLNSSQAYIFRSRNILFNIERYHLKEINPELLARLFNKNISLNYYLFNNRNNLNTSENRTKTTEMLKECDDCLFPNLEKIKPKLAADEELIMVRELPKKDSVVYAILILNKNKPPELLFLDIAITNATIHINQLWDFIATKISTKKLFYSSDGVISFSNISTAIQNNGKYVFEDYQIRHISSLYEFEYPLEQQRSNTAALFGNPKFLLSKNDLSRWKTSSTEVPIFIEPNSTRSGISPLPYTEREVNSISEILQKSGFLSKAYLDMNANEKEIKSLQSPRVVHIATHGYFNADLTDAEIKENVREQHPYQKNNPMIRSGLLLAGSQNYLTTPDEMVSKGDGILTSSEILKMNLKDTELVVLSACDTGLGEIVNGEGVFGLQRAFKIAGAQSILMSLSKVPDEATQIMMTTFYDNWINKGMTKHEALRQTQMTMKSIDKYKDPRNWGSFILLE
jgi:CHAT domain-containing protein